MTAATAVTVSGYDRDEMLGTQRDTVRDQHICTVSRPYPEPATERTFNGAFSGHSGGWEDAGHDVDAG